MNRIVYSQSLQKDTLPESFTLAGISPQNVYWYGFVKSDY